MLVALDYVMYMHCYLFMSWLIRTLPTHYCTIHLGKEIRHLLYTFIKKGQDGLSLQGHVTCYHGNTLQLQAILDMVDV